MGSPLASWPWASLGSYKYLLYGPLAAKAAHAWWETGSPPVDSWCLHLLLLLALRSLTFQLWFSYGNMLFFTRRRRVVKDGVDFRQIDDEWDWDNLVILQTLIAAMVANSPAFPGVAELRAWDPRGWALALLLHVTVSEPAFYWAHRALHRDPLFSRYHAKHHSSPVTQPFTAGFGTPLEALVLTAAMGAPLAGAFAAGAGSVSLVYAHVLLFDYLRCMAYSNVEVISHRAFAAVPALRYLVYTPTYLSLHHREKDCNFCLFMPLFDALGGTINSRSWELQKEGERPGAGLRVPGARGGRGVVDARALRVPLLQLAALHDPPRAAAALAHRLRLHGPPMVLLQDLHRQLLLPPRPAPPDLERPQIQLPVFHSIGEEGHKPADRARHPEGGQDGRQSDQPCCAQQERGAQWRRHAVREQAPEPEGEGGAWQHPDGGRDPERDPQQHEGGVPHRRDVQARQGHRALPLQEEDQGPDANAVDGEVPQDPEGGAGRVPAVPRAGHQVPGGAELQDVDRGQVAVAAGAAVGAGGHPLPPVRGAAHHRLPAGLHLRQARRHEAPQGRRGPRLLRVHHGARGGARVPRRRRRALPRGLEPPRGRRTRRRPDRRRLEGRAQARAHAGVTERPPPAARPE